MQVLKVSAGLQHVLVMTELDGCFAFGNNGNGRLGLGDTQDRLEPVRIEALEQCTVISLHAGGDFSLAIVGRDVKERQVLTWGHGKDGRLGHGDEKDKLKPLRVAELQGKRISKASCGGAHVLLLSDKSYFSNSGNIWSFGQGTYGQLGQRDNYNSLIPRNIDELRLEPLCQISAGERHSMAMSDDGVIFSWGHGVPGEKLQYEIDVESHVVLYPRKVQLKNIRVAKILAGYERSFAWGDKTSNDLTGLGSEIEEVLCSSMPQKETLRSDKLRILYSCSQCQLEKICPNCAVYCHRKHCTTLYCTDIDPLSTACSCKDNGKCQLCPDEDDLIVPETSTRH